MSGIFKNRKVDSKADKKKVIGAYCPLPLIEYISLYAMVEETSNSSLLGRWLGSLKEEKQKEGRTTEKLIEELVNFIYASWLKSSLTPADFETSLRSELLKNHISEIGINAIVSKFKEYEESNR